MISLKDIPMLLGMAGTLLTGGFYVHDIKRDVAELGVDYRQHVAEQQETTLYEKKWKLEKRMQEAPLDGGSREELEIVNRLLEKNKLQQQHLKGGS